MGAPLGALVVRAPFVGASLVGGSVSFPAFGAFFDDATGCASAWACATEERAADEREAADGRLVAEGRAAGLLMSTMFSLSGCRQECVRTGDAEDVNLQAFSSG